MAKITPLASSQKTLTITLPAPQETLQTTPTTLPNVEPSAGNEQLSYTVQTTDLPAFNIDPYSKIWVAAFYGAGKFASAGNLSWRMKKNEANIANGTDNVTSSNVYYTKEFYFYDVHVGDVLKVALWSSRTDSNWDYTCYFILPSRVCPSKNRLYTQVSYSNFTGVSMSLGTCASQGSFYAYWFNDDKGGLDLSTASLTFKVLYNGSINNYGLFRAYYSDYVNLNGSPSIVTSSTQRPRYRQNMIPTIISYRVLDTSV